MSHMMTVRGDAGEPSYETDRMRFIGRGGTLAAPRRCWAEAHFPTVKDPCSIRSLHSPDRHDRCGRVGDGRYCHRCGRVARRGAGPDREVQDLAWPIASSTWPGRTARSCCSSSVLPKRMPRFMADWPARSSMRASLRGAPSVLSRNRRGQSGLWGYGISGDLPIVLVRIRDRGEHRSGAPSGAGACLLATEGARGRSGDLERRRFGLSADSCRTDRRSRRRQSRSARRPARRHFHSPRRTDVGRRSHCCSRPVARVIVSDDGGTLAEQAERRGRAEVSIPQLKPTRPPARAAAASPLSTIWFSSTA